MPKLLIVAPSWVGDAVMMQPMLQLLRARDASARMDVLAPAWCAPVIARMAEVTAIIPNPFAHGELALGARWRLGRKLARDGYTQAVLLPNSAKSALLPWFAGIPRRTGFLGERRYGLINDRPGFAPTSLPRLVDRYAGLALGRVPNPGETPLPRLTIDPGARADCLARLQLDLTRPIIALCPGAEYGPAKRWPVEHFAAIARRGLAEGYNIWLIGSAKDQAVTGAIAQAATGIIDLAGKTRLDQVIDLLSAASVVISNDSGLMHLAGAVGVPLIALYGSSSPAYTPPLSDRARILCLDLPCSPCFKRECPLGHLRCLKEIAPEEVWCEVASYKSRPG
ncbi:MAG: lipopolysaccharide heptosyltransferase II [Betaproteobacteria bacterium]|nr:lipopolysaccharide heptosyltransferase II [Betaproteobacteria bacterium]